MNWKKEWKKFISDYQGKFLVFLLILSVISLIFVIWLNSLF